MLKMSLPPLFETFRLCCEARSELVRAGGVGFDEALDGLAAAAKAYDLASVVGQAAVEEVVRAAFTGNAEHIDDDRPPAACCDVCGYALCSTPGFCNECRAADKNPHVVAERKCTLTQRPPNWDPTDFGVPYRALNKRDGVAKSTLDAAGYLIRINDPKRFETWLLQHSPIERAAIVDHINKKRD